MQKEKAKQGLPLLDFPAKDFLSFPNSIKRHCQNQLPVKKLVWKYASFLSLEIGPQRSDLFTSYFHLTADSRRFSPLPCEKILCSTDLWNSRGCLILQSPEMLGKYGSWWVVKIQWRALLFCFIVSPISSQFLTYPSILISVRKLLDISQFSHSIHVLWYYMLLLW